MKKKKGADDDDPKATASAASQQADEGNKDFLVGSRNMTLTPVIFSLMGATLSGISVLGYPSEIYSYGSLAFNQIFSQMLFIPLMGYLFIPIFYNLHLTSLYSYLEMRYESRLLRLMVSSIIVLDSFAYLGIILYTPALALNAVLDFPTWAGIMVVGGGATLYTAFGGFHAVVWIEFFQTLVLISGLFMVLIKGLIQVGGIQETFDIVANYGKLEWFDFSVDPFKRQTTWSIVFSTGFFWGGLLTNQPAQVMRFCSLKTLKDAKKAVFLSTAVLNVIYIVTGMCGMVILANYAGCDPVDLKAVTRSDQMVPYFALNYFQIVPGLLGLFMASLFSGVLSSVSPLVNSTATILWDDFVLSLRYFREMKQHLQVYVIKAIGVGVGIIGVAMAYLIGLLGGGVFQLALAINGALRGPIYGLFLLGAIVPMVEKKGAIASFILTEVLLIWFSAGSTMYSSHSPRYTGVDQCTNETLHRFGVDRDQSSLTEHHEKVGLDWPLKVYELSFTLIPVIAALTVTAIAVPISACVGQKMHPSKLKGLVHPLAMKLWCRRSRDEGHVNGGTYKPKDERGIEEIQL